MDLQTHTKIKEVLTNLASYWGQ